MDIYSCKDFCVDRIIDFVKETMDIIHGGYMIIDRNTVLPETKQIGII
jgi:hypothetical protein